MLAYSFHFAIQDFILQFFFTLRRIWVIEAAQLVQNDADGPDVRSFGGLLVQPEFWRHVEWSSDTLSFLGDVVYISKYDLVS